MKFSIVSGCWLSVAAIYSVTTIEAYTTSVPKVTNSANTAMSQYEAALKAAFEQAAATQTTPTNNPMTSSSTSTSTSPPPSPSLQESFPQVKAPASTMAPTDEVVISATTNNRHFSVSPHMMNNNHAFVEDNDGKDSGSANPITTTTTTAAVGVVPQEELHAAASSAFLRKHIEQQENAVDQYEAAIKAAFESTTTPPSPPTTIVFDNDEQQEQQNNSNSKAVVVDKVELLSVAVVAASKKNEQDQELNWDSISKDITNKIISAESEQGGKPLSAAATGEIVGTVLAGSAVLGSAAIGSPLVMGAALGYASTHVLGGKRGEALSKASKLAMTDAIQFSKSQLELEHGDISKASKRILTHIQHEANDRFSEVQNELTNQAHHVTQEISMAPSLIAEKTKQLVTSDEFKSMPLRSFKAFTTFLKSEEVQNAKNTAVKAMKDGLESDELKAVQKRATISLKDIASPSSSSSSSSS